MFWAEARPPGWVPACPLSRGAVPKGVHLSGHFFKKKFPATPTWNYRSFTQLLMKLEEK